MGFRIELLIYNTKNLTRNTSN